MDDYKEFYYAAVPVAKHVRFGNIQERLTLKRRLGCKPFSWYLKNVYPELRVPQSSDAAFGALQQGQKCLDTMGQAQNNPLHMYPCHNTGGNQVSNTVRLFFSLFYSNHFCYQDFSMTRDDLIKHADLCLTFIPEGRPNVSLLPCKEDKNQVSSDY
jgi:polypeptide N-acetylgalactosaminyltransferase